MTRAQAGKLARNIAQHKGEFVIVRGTEVIAHDRKYRRALDKVPADKTDGAYVRFSPKKKADHTVYSSW